MHADTKRMYLTTKWPLNWSVKKILNEKKSCTLLFFTTMIKGKGKGKSISKKKTFSQLLCKLLTINKWPIERRCIVQVNML